MKKTKLQDLPLEERLETYLKIEYQKALDEFILMLGMTKVAAARYRQWVSWVDYYTGFLSRILKEHLKEDIVLDLSECKAKLDEWGIECELSSKRSAFAVSAFAVYEDVKKCLTFSIDGVSFSLFKEGTRISLCVDEVHYVLGDKSLKMTSLELIDGIRLSTSYIPRIKKMMADAEKQAPTVAMVRKIKRAAKKSKTIV